MSKLIRAGLNLFWAGWWGIGLALLLWLPLRWWPGDRFWPVQLGNYFMPWLLAGLIPGLGLAALARRDRLLAVLLGPAVVIGLMQLPLFLPPSEVALAGNRQIRVMSYNVLYHNDDPAAMARTIRQAQPDIVLLQELLPDMAQALPAELADLYPELYFAYEPTVVQGVISRYPLESTGLEYLAGRTQKVAAHTPYGPVQLWNTHPSQPLPYWPLQRQQIALLARQIAAVEGPLIVGGDFNTTSHAETYRMVNRHLANAHWEMGWGFGFTFPADRPLVRIDHIFYSRHFQAHRAYTLTESGGSDHFPVVADLVIVD